MKTTRLNNATITGRKAMLASNKTRERREVETKIAIDGFYHEYFVNCFDNEISEFTDWTKEDIYEELAVDGSSENMQEYLVYISMAKDSDYYFYKMPNKTSVVIEVYFNNNNLVDYAIFKQYDCWFGWM